MDRPDIDKALASLAAEPRPHLEPGWQDAVMCRIRKQPELRKTTVVRGVFLPHFGYGSLAAGLAVAFVTGAAVGLLNTSENLPLANTSTPLTIFSPAAPHLPATLMLSDR